MQRELTQLEQLPFIAAEWEPITCVIDSGAVDHVIPKKYADAANIRPNQMTMAGESYVAANGSPIESYGDTTIKGRTDDWTPLNISFNVAAVRKPLISSTRLTECGHKVNLQKGNSYIGVKNSTRRIPLRTVNGCPAFTFWKR